MSVYFDDDTLASFIAQATTYFTNDDTQGALFYISLVQIEYLARQDKHAQQRTTTTTEAPNTREQDSFEF